MGSDLIDPIPFFIQMPREGDDQAQIPNRRQINELQHNYLTIKELTILPIILRFPLLYCIFPLHGHVLGAKINLIFCF